jgi:hypothetical protein
MAFRSGLYREVGFSFNEEDMADLLERMIVMRAQAHSIHNNSEPKA